MCIVNSKKKLSPEGPEFIPTSVIHSVQLENSIFAFTLSRNDFDTDDDEPLCSHEEGQSSFNILTPNQILVHVLIILIRVHNLINLSQKLNFVMKWHY